jgi:hypothetical protein
VQGSGKAGTRQGRGQGVAVGMAGHWGMKPHRACEGRGKAGQMAGQGRGRGEQGRAGQGKRQDSGQGKG